MPSSGSSKWPPTRRLPACLAGEVRRLRRLLVEVYPHVNDTKGTEQVQAELEREVAEIRAAERKTKKA